jgi:hypothetical protein
MYGNMFMCLSRSSWLPADPSHEGKIRRYCMDQYAQCLEAAEIMAREFRCTDFSQTLTISVIAKILEAFENLEHCSMRFWRVLKRPTGTSQQSVVSPGLHRAPVAILGLGVNT